MASSLVARLPGSEVTGNQWGRTKKRAGNDLNTIC